MKKGKIVDKKKKIEKNVTPAIFPQSPEECLNALADIIIERILEERTKGTNV